MPVSPDRIERAAVPHMPHRQKAAEVPSASGYRNEHGHDPAFPAARPYDRHGSRTTPYDR